MVGMLRRMDGVLVAVRDAEAAARTYGAVLGARTTGGYPSALLGGQVTVLEAGSSRIRLVQPGGAGPAAQRIDAAGEGLLGVVLATGRRAELRSRLEARGLPVAEEGDALHLPPEVMRGCRVAIVDDEPAAGPGPVSFLYEVTHLVDDWRAASAEWTDVFALDDSRYHPISSDLYGYDGVLTLFDPPARLDRIEVVDPHDRSKAMGRYFDRYGQTLYMCYGESADMGALRRALDAAGARYEANGPDREVPEGLFIHPSALHGVLMGMGRVNLGWRWSGRPELADAPRA